jgi:CRISPR-associated protein Csd2
MFEHDRSAARGEMSTRGLYVFKHDSELGNASAHNLFDLIQAKKNTEEPARDFSDYSVKVNAAGLPTGVTLQRIVG